MLFQINDFRISELAKAQNDAVVSVDIIANHLTEDTEGETTLKEAFSPEAVQDFLNIGVIEFWHESRNPMLSKHEKNEAIIGKPVGFRWENGLPVVTANLTKSHPIVKTMMPHLRAAQPVYAASLGGGKMVMEVSDSQGQKHRVIPKIKWDHLAIAPSNSVINREPGMNVRLLQKANEIMCEFDNLQSFARNSNIAEKEEVLRKALEAPASVSDMYDKPGGVVTKQSLDQKISNLTLSDEDGLDLIDTILGIKQKRIPTGKADYMVHFEKCGKKDFGKKSFDLIDKYMKSGRKIN